MMKMQMIPWGVTRDGEQAQKYILTNGAGMEVTLSDFSASIIDIRLPVNGAMRSVVLGYDTMDEYYQLGPEFAGFVGRNGNRIANGQVILDGVTYQLEQNNNGHNLHSGSKRSYFEFYRAVTGEDKEGIWVEFSRVSPQLEQGFPGNLDQKIRYTLTETNDLFIDYRMVSDQTTIINHTCHTYFNLMGHNSGDILSHKLTIHSNAFLPTDDTLIPTGEERSVEGTPFDFRQMHTIGERIGEAYEPLLQAGGYDHNYCFANDGVMKELAKLESPDGSVCMTVSADTCGMQVYTGNFLAVKKGKEGASYALQYAVCLETQSYPNACNTPGFATTVYNAGQVYKSRTCYGFAF